MAGYNRVVMIGNLTRDPDYRQLASGQAVCKLGLATNRQFRNRQTGDMIQEVCYVDIDVWGAQAESCRQYLQKGRPVLIEGRLKFDTWQDPNGQNRSRHTIVADRVVFLGTSTGPEDESQKTQSSSSNQSQFDPELEKELMSQIDQIKTRASQKTKPATKAQARPKKEEQQGKPLPTGEIDFKDQPPFEDDLPF